MSLAQEYRLRLAAKQSQRLLVCLAAAVAFHAGAIVSGLLVWQQARFQKHPLEKPLETPSPVPVDFVYLDPKQAAPAQKPVDTKRHAQVDAIASGKHSEDLPINAGKPGSIAAPAEVPPVPSRPSPSPSTAPPPVALPSPEPLSSPVPSPAAIATPIAPKPTASTASQPSRPSPLPTQAAPPSPVPEVASPATPDPLPSLQPANPVLPPIAADRPSATPTPTPRTEAAPPQPIATLPPPVPSPQVRPALISQPPSPQATPTPRRLAALPPKPPTPPAPHTPSPQTVAPTSALRTNSAPPAAASQLGGVVARSAPEQTGQGLDGISNSNRTTQSALASVDATRDDVWGDYIAALNQKIDQHWQRISVATTRQSKVKFIVNRQGDLVSAELVQSSGDATADQTAIQAVQTAAPFAPLPEHATENLLIINFTFTYHVASNAP